MGTEDFSNKTDEWKGAAKQTFGELTDDEELQAEGAGEKAKAKAKQTYQDVKDNVQGAAEVVKDKARDAFDR